MRIAPKVESLANRDLTELAHPNPDQLSEEDLALREIRRVVGEYAPQERHSSRGTVMAPIPEISALRRARHEAGLLDGLAPGQSAGMHSFNTVTGEVRSYNSVEEFRASMFRAQREGEQNMISQLMEAINALRASNPQPPSTGTGINVTI